MTCHSDMFIIAVYMFDSKLSEFKKTYIHTISDKEVKFTTKPNAKKYRSELRASRDVKLLGGFKSSYCKTLNVLLERI